MNAGDDDLTAEQRDQALNQSWADAAGGSAGSNLLARMRDSIANIDTSSDAPKLTKEEFLAELSRRR